VLEDPHTGVVLGALRLERDPEQASAPAA
jgi:hypothetical protein